jgi:hypothetical protein
VLPFLRKSLEKGFKYLGFLLKSNAYGFEDSFLLFKKEESRITLWVNIWFFRGGRLVLIKSILQGIQVYWTSIEKVPKGILTKIWKKCFQFLWSKTHEQDGIPQVKWSSLSKPKNLGDWGIKNMYLFSQALVDKSVWRIT